MKIFLRLICSLLIFSLCIGTVGFADDKPEFNVENYTTTRINDWLVNYHFTTVSQVENGIRGSDSAQNTFAYAISPVKDHIHLLATNTTGIYRSDDGGQNWVTSSDGLEQNGANTLVFHPDIPNVVFATVFCGNNSINNPAGDGIYKSDDYGKTWKKVLQKYYYSQTRGSNNISFGELNEDGIRTMYASTYRDGVYKSENNGETWTLLGQEGRILRGINYNNGIITVWGDSEGLYQSSDGGLTFLQKTEGLPDDNAVYSIAVDPLNKAHIICIAGSETALYESLDYGSSWEMINSEFGERDSGSQLRCVKFGAVCADNTVNMYVSIRQCKYMYRHQADCPDLLCNRCVF